MKLGAGEPLLRLIWTDQETGARGYCVIDRLVGGIATGGTRMRAGCTLSEVEDLARGMSAKAGVFDADVLVPAAVSYALTPDNCAAVRAPLVVEAANVPTTPDAERLLLERGVLAVPDFVANGGAAAFAWWTLFGDVSADSQDAFAKLSADMRAVIEEILAVCDRGLLSPRAVALVVAQRNLDRFEADHAAPRKAIR